MFTTLGDKYWNDAVLHRRGVKELLGNSLAKIITFKRLKRIKFKQIHTFIASGFRYNGYLDTGVSCKFDNRVNEDHVIPHDHRAR